ncbi:MAG: hypothetical protein LUQ28_00155 [Methylococcaceae bacterium]|nr:hypothetical protein [Methylococcaceae bacterium]MDD1614941.1 hypothetical protein [Methylococcaceae bacterium]
MTNLLSISFFKTYSAWLLLPFLGIFFGVLASTADPLAIGMSASSFIGIALLSKPTWNVDLIIVLGLFVSGLVTLFFGDLATKMMWGVSILGFVLLMTAFYRLITTPQLIKSTPAFVWIALLFFIYTLVDSVLQLYTAKEIIGGFKRYFQAWGLLFGLCWLDFNKKNVDRWCLLVLGICLLQAPFCLYEKLVLVPFREGYVESLPGLEAIDVVAGTFGALMLGGGNSAEMAVALIMMFAFLLARYQANMMPSKQLLWLSLLLLSPLGMGETKIVVIFFPLMIAVLYRKEFLSRPHYLVVALIFGTLFTAITLNVYMIINKTTLDGLIFDTLKYNVYEVGYGSFYLNRTTVLTFWAEHQSSANPLSFLFGNGLGSTQEGDSSGPGGHISMRYPSSGLGFTGAAMLLWELGVFGVSLFLLMIALAWRCANRVIKVAVDPVARADATAIQAGLFLFAIYPFYLNSLFNQFSFQMLFTFMLGYLAWLHKQSVENES